MKRIIPFIALFLFYVTICLITITKLPESDELRYLAYAHNLTNGFYAPRDTLMLWNGPGYPLVLYPFVKLGMPAWAGRCLNPLFLIGGVIFLYAWQRFYVSRKQATIGAFLFGLYPPLLPDMTQLLTEPLTIFLVCGFCFLTTYTVRNKSGWACMGAGLFGGFLILTKVLFAYVYVIALALALLWTLVRDRGAWRLPAIAGLSLLFCAPYLFYTASLTHRFFYWANSGGSMLYWISDPCLEHLGDWHNETVVRADPRYSAHRSLFEELEGKDYVQQDTLLKTQAIRNLKANPGKYVYNCIANAGRLWFNYPYTYKVPRPHSLFYMVPNAILLGGFVFCICPLARTARKLPKEVIALVLWTGIYLALSTALPATSRYLIPAVPILLFLMVYTFTVVLEIRFREPLSDS